MRKTQPSVLSNRRTCMLLHYSRGLFVVRVRPRVRSSHSFACSISRTAASEPQAWCFFRSHRICRENAKSSLFVGACGREHPAQHTENAQGSVFPVFYVNWAHYCRNLFSSSLTFQLPASPRPREQKKNNKHSCRVNNNLRLYTCVV